MIEKTACERCGSNEKLLVHHKDRDRYNNVKENLGCLCKRCHQLEHECGKHLPKDGKARAEWLVKQGPEIRDSEGRFVNLRKV
jgi:hypothetical protein